MNWRRTTLAIVLGALCVLLMLWLARARLAEQAARAYFQSHGIASTVEIGTFGLSGASARFALGPADAPDIAADSLELRFDPLSWLPRVVEVRLVNPTLRARIDANGKVTLPSLQHWLESLQGGQGHSRFISDDLAVALTGLRAILTTPGGVVEVNGDVKLVHNRPVTAALRARPATIVFAGQTLTLRAATLNFDDASGRLTAHLSGDVKNKAQGLDANLRAEGLRWNGLSGSASSLHLKISTAMLSALTQSALDLTVRNVAISLGSSGIHARADLQASGNTGLALADAPLTRNLRHLNFAFGAHVEAQDDRMIFALTAPLDVRGTGGAALRVSVLNLSGNVRNLTGTLDASVSGGGLPDAKLALQDFSWRGDAVTADANLSARFSHAMLHGADIGAAGKLTWQAGRYAFAPSACARIALAAFHPGASDLARNLRGQLCVSGAAPLIAGEGANWAFTGDARGTSAFLPLASAKADKAIARLSFTGHGADARGTVTLTTAQFSDAAPSLRFKPLLASGSMTLESNVWRGRAALSDAGKNPLGEATFTHRVANGTGAAHLSAPHMMLAPGKLQPDTISPLLVAFRHAEGVARFSGDIRWTRAAITSEGVLNIDSLDFLTPLGKAHTVKTEMVFTSLLPPVTADNQEVKISRIDWTLPFSTVDLHFAFSPTAIKVGSVSTNIADGHAGLGGFTVDLSNPKHIEGAATLSSIALGALVTASNLGSRVKLDGKISGSVPFVVTPDGFRIANGHVASDGPGRLSIDRALWTQGGAATSSVQDFAYQALENLAFDSLTADLNSVAGGRLSVLFHIKGHSDPPKLQTADIAVTDILNGTALQKQIPLPSGTPIDLTLDTSLNFDELLKSYAEAWSNTLSPAKTPSSHPETKRGAAQ